MKLRILAIIFLLFFVFSCETDTESYSYFDLGNENEFQINTEYWSNDRELKFSISEINDSRCPTGVYCIWAGEARITIAIESPSIDTLVLSSYHQQTGSSNGYDFILGEVAPYPNIDQEIKQDDYVVLVKIDK